MKQVQVTTRWTLLLLLLLQICLSVATSAETPGQPVAHQGVMDLRNFAFDKQDASLSGEWKWYWHQLLSPADTSNQFAYTPFPVLWKKSSWQGQSLPSSGYATYSLLILVPDTRQELALYVPDTYSSYRLFLNGNLIAHNGTPGTTKASTIPYWSTQLKPIPVTGDTLHLLLQIANFHHSKGGPYKQIRLGDPVLLQKELDQYKALDFFLTGCLFMGGLFFLGLFLFGRHETSILYFSLFCIVYSYRIVGSKLYSLHTLFPNQSWTLTVHFEYLSLYLGILLFVLYTHSLYTKDSNPLIMKIMAWICGGFIGTVLLLPPLIFTQYINLFLGLMPFYMSYALYIYVIAARKKRPGAVYALLSTGVLLAVFLSILLEYFRLIEAQRLVLFAGYISFFFLQSLILSFRFTNALQKAKLQAEEGSKTKSDFLSTMSHEIRTPLNALIGMTHLLLQNNPRAEQKQQLDVMLFSANNLLHIVNDILDFSKIEAGKIMIEAIPMDIATIVNNVIKSYRSLAEEKRVKFHGFIDLQLPQQVIGDPTRMTQVLLNLTHNALKFTQQGHVSINVRVEELTEQDVTLTISIEDTGIGISPDKQEIIFNQFTQADSSMSRNFGGTGLGLAICKRLLELQGVHLSLKSELGQGTTFFFTQTFHRVKLPLSSPTVPAKPVLPAAKPDKPLNGISVLVVEDNPMNVLLAETILQRMGATTDVAENGRIALEKWSEGKYRLIFMDLQMPEMDGYEATRLLRGKGVKIPIIALTASLLEEVEDEVNKTGFDDVLIKPFHPDDLLRVVLKHIEAVNS